MLLLPTTKMVLIELVYCKITGRTRALPKIHHFIPLEPWSCKKIKGKKRVMPVADNRDEDEVVEHVHTSNKECPRGLVNKNRPSF